MLGFNILNLERRKDRYYTMVGHLETIGVPFDNVTFHKGIDGRDYNSQDAGCDDAIADGFTSFDQLRSWGIGTICGTWSALRILRYIASDENPFKFSYFNYDDKLLGLTYSELLHLIKHLNKVNKHPFRLLQLFQNPDIYQKREPLSPDSYVCEGLHVGGDSGLVLSREGCLLLLDTFKKRPEMLQSLLGSLDKNLPGIYCIDSKFSLIKNIGVRYFNKSYEEDQDRMILDNTSRS